MTLKSRPKSVLLAYRLIFVAVSEFRSVECYKPTIGEAEYSLEI